MPDMAASALQSPAPPLVLSGKQRALLEALQKHHDILAEMYRGVLYVLSQPGHPDRLALAAHGLRELAEKLPRYLELPSDVQRARLQPAALAPKVSVLLSEWKQVRNSSSCSTADGWQGQIDRRLQRFLKRLEAFAEWYDAEIPSLLERTARFLDVFDPLASALPEKIRAMRAEEFKVYRDYFTAVAHHGSSVNPEEFDKYVMAFEQFMIERLRPITFEHFDAIDVLIKEVESDQA